MDYNCLSLLLVSKTIFLNLQFDEEEEDEEDEDYDEDEDEEDEDDDETDRVVKNEFNIFINSKLCRLKFM